MKINIKYYLFAQVGSKLSLLGLKRLKASEDRDSARRAPGFSLRKIFFNQKENGTRFSVASVLDI